MALFAALAALSACGARTEARTPPLVALRVPPTPPRVAIPVSLPEQAAEPEERPAPPTTTPAATSSRTRVDVPSSRPTAERSTPPSSPTPPAPATAAASDNQSAPVLQTTINVGAVEQRANSLLGEAVKTLERVNRAQLGAQARAHYDRAISYIRDGRNALQGRRFAYAEQLAVKAAALARALVQG